MLWKFKVFSNIFFFRKYILNIKKVILRNPNTSNPSLFQILSAPIDREVAARILGQSGTVELKTFVHNFHFYICCTARNLL